jgi:hypothetical protein
VHLRRALRETYTAKKRRYDVPEELQKEMMTSRDLNCEFSVSKGGRRGKRGLHFQVWFNNWRDFGCGFELNTPWLFVSQKNWFSKGYNIPSAVIRHLAEIVESGEDKKEGEEEEPKEKLQKRGNAGYM